MEYQFIRKQKGDIYSIYHAPESFSNDQVGIVLCYPYAQEYIRCHKLYVNMANKLSALGFHVLRFDYYGTGDSGGDFPSITIADSLEDIDLAINELKASCDISKVILTGVRFGATLSLLYAKKHKVDGLVLWNPIIDGSKYLRNIDADYRRWLSGSFTKEKKISGTGMSNFGFLFSAAFKQEIKNTCIQKTDLVNRVPTLLLDEGDTLGISNSPNVTFFESVNKEYWLKRENELSKSMIPVRELNKTLEWVVNTEF